MPHEIGTPRSSGQPPPSAGAGGDLARDQHRFYFRPAAWMKSTGLITGYTGTTEKPYPRPKVFAQRAANTMAPWCWGVPITTFGGGGNGYASFQARGFAGYPSSMVVTERIHLGTNWISADYHPARAVQLHECAHILQYRAYRYDSDALDAAMNRIYPHDRYDGVEHMADCIADAMGARRSHDRWTVGYGGTCDDAQMAAARQVIAGGRA